MQSANTYIVRIWVGEGVARRIMTFTITAPSLFDAKAIIIAQYGKNNVISVT
jgi:hypothetical protein